MDFLSKAAETKMAAKRKAAVLLASSTLILKESRLLGPNGLSL